MKKISLSLLAACLVSCVMFTGCKNEPGEEVLTKPLVKFEETSNPNLVKATITSDFDLKTVTVEKFFGANDPMNETVTTITSFSNPRSYVYEQTFTVPNGILAMDIRITAENVKGLSTTVSKTLEGEVVITQADVADAMAAAYGVWTRDGELPYEISILGFKFTKEQYFEYACNTLINLADGQDKPLTLTGYAAAEIPDLDNFVDAEVSVQMLVNQSTRQLNWAANNGLWANYVGYGTESGVVYEDTDGTTYQGRFSFERGLVCLARVFDHYKTNGSLPAKVSSTFKEIPPFTPEPAGTFTQAALADAFAAAYTQFETTGAMPETITVNGTELNKLQYFHASAKFILNLKDNSAADIEVLTYLAPEDPARDTYDLAEVNVLTGPANSNGHTEDLANVAQRMINYASNPALGNGLYANFAGYVRGEGDEAETVEFSFNRASVCFARAIAAYKAAGTTPDKVAANYLPPTTVSEFVTEYVKLLEVWEASGNAGERSPIPDNHTMTVDGMVYSKANFFETACRILLALNDGGQLTNFLPALSYYAPAEDPSREDTAFTPGEAGMDLLVNMANRQINYAANPGLGNGMFANYVGYTGGQVAGYGGMCSFDRGVLMLARMFKYILDNNITENFSTQLAGVKVSSDLK